jgi:peptide/nickel transport system permease protein
MTLVAALGGLGRRRSQTRAPWQVVVVGGFLAVLILGAALSPYLPLEDPNMTALLAVNSPPSADHILGTDALGRDILARVFWGARTSLVGPALVSLLATAVGTCFALVAAWRRGLTDASVGFAVDVTLAFPALLLGIVSAAVFGKGLAACVLAVTVAYIPYATRIVRGVAVTERAKPYVAALDVQGHSGLRISVRHVLPNIARYVGAMATLSFGYAMVDLAALSFLGLGVQPPTADWGSMVAEGQSALVDGHPQESLAAGTLIVLAVIGLNIIGEHLARDRER